MLLQEDGNQDPYSLRTTPNAEDTAQLASPGLVTPVMSTANSSKITSEASTSRTPLQASTPKLRMMLKHTLQDALAEGSAKENLILKHLGAQKHECAISELELKHCKLENKVMEKQHQQEQHEYCMLQMQLMMSQNQLSAAAWPPMMQVHNPSLFDRYGLMTELNAGSVPSKDPLPSLSSYP